MRIIVIGFTVLVVFFSGAPATAQTSANFGGPNGGSVIPGWDSRACGGGGSPGGAIRYNSATTCTEYCDGTDWVCPAASGPSGCANVGDECDDGTIFAGLSPDGYEAMYTTPSDGGGLPWNNGNSSGIVNLYTPTTESTTGGEASTAAFIGVDSDSDTGGVQPFQAPEYCYNLDVHGHQDWYVPARDEFFVLYDNQVDIGGFGSTYYWTATEVTVDAMIYVNITDGSTGSGLKNFGNEVRCVRKGDPPWGSSGGCTAPASCTSVGDVCSDGSIFAGFMVYNNSSCEPLYVTDDNQGSAVQWKTSTGADDISVDDDVDGKTNVANLNSSISNFPAFDLCDSNTYHDKSDWYLPSRAELELLMYNQAAIDANAANSFSTSDYWSSTEAGTLRGFHVWFGGRELADDFKDDTDYVRCVRRD